MEYTNSQIKSLIDEHIHSQRDREMLYRRLVDGVKLEPLAEEFGVSVRQCKSIVNKGKTEVFRHL